MCILSRLVGCTTPDTSHGGQAWRSPWRSILRPQRWQLISRPFKVLCFLPLRTSTCSSLGLRKSSKRKKVGGDKSNLSCWGKGKTPLQRTRRGRAEPPLLRAQPESLGQTELTRRSVSGASGLAVALAASKCAPYPHLSVCSPRAALDVGGPGRLRDTGAGSQRALLQRHLQTHSRSPSKGRPVATPASPAAPGQGAPSTRVPRGSAICRCGGQRLRRIKQTLPSGAHSVSLGLDLGGEETLEINETRGGFFRKSTWGVL